jgi:RNA polymerase sigma factor (sigma-70 family)
MSTLPHPSPQRSSPDLAELYRAFAARLEQIVGSDVAAPEPVIEDACQFAWGGLVSHATHLPGEAAVPWLITTAVREAVRLVRRADRDVPLHEDGLAADAQRAAPTAPDQLVEDRERLRLTRQLPERQQRIMWLQALGMSYGEIAAYTGDSPRTVQRQLLRARRRIRQLAV